MGKPGGGAEVVEDFAACVRGLKERSGRSYGALARRLNVGASTLHRYCSGEAVPTDFALLERLARLCGATPEERMELHRLWVGALEARGDRERAGRGAAEPEEPEESDESDESERPASGGMDREERERARPASGSPAPAVPPRPARRRRTVLVVAGALALVVVALAGLLLPNDSPESAEPAEPRAAEAPLTWTTDSHAWQAGCDHRYLVDGPVDEVPPPPTEQDARAWAESVDAVHGEGTLVEITLQGRSSTAVVLQALHVRVVERAAPARGNVLRMNDGCGGALTPRFFDVDLDAARPVARSVAGNDTGTEIPAVTFPYRVSADDPEVLLVDARTVDCDCRWYLELEWSSQGRSGSVRIDDHGSPFRTSGVEGLPQYGYDWAAERWTAAIS
ncbi:helix-turn-helix transcriptional regulator [Streptomyces sp. B6B3]|uniref:helix-turn-helix domain-containing protein n=1 Tax=Streptomyces sp. B6B3 TaxID=3153570 RepID=UPI00325F7037